MNLYKSLAHMQTNEQAVIQDFKATSSKYLEISEICFLGYDYARNIIMLINSRYHQICICGESIGDNIPW